MATPKKTIITCAITGSSHTPTMSPYLPYTPDDMVYQSIDAAKAGDSIVHLHARNPHDGSPSADPTLFRDYVTRIKAESDVIISLTAGGATGQSIEERLNVIKSLQPELCTCNLGTLNYGLYPMTPAMRANGALPGKNPIGRAPSTNLLSATFPTLRIC